MSGKAHALTPADSARYDSLKKECDYETCREYIKSMKREYRKQITVDSLSFWIPIVKSYPEYFETFDNDTVARYAKIFSPDYGCPSRVRVKAGITYNALTQSRENISNKTRRIIKSLMSDIFYSDLVLERDTTENRNEYFNKLMSEEMRIRQKSTKTVFVSITNNKPATDKFSSKTKFYKQAGKRFVVTSSRVLPDGTRQVDYASQSIPSLNKVNTRSVKVSYIDDYFIALQKANLASLHVILDDHIRRGVAIDVSWIPESTMTIISNKKIRDLEKQINTIKTLATIAVN